MIIATMRDEGRIGEKANGKNAQYDSDTDTDMDDDVVEVKDDKVGWAYIGSHNFTPSAWGNLSGSSFNPILNVRVFLSRYKCSCTDELLLSRSQIMNLAWSFHSETIMMWIGSLVGNGRPRSMLSVTTCHG